MPKAFTQVQAPRQSEVSIALFLGALVISQALDIIHVVLVAHACRVRVMGLQEHTLKSQRQDEEVRRCRCVARSNSLQGTSEGPLSGTVKMKSKFIL